MWHEFLKGHQASDITASVVQSVPIQYTLENFLRCVTAFAHSFYDSQMTIVYGITCHNFLDPMMNVMYEY
jgi:hypothetical protein